MSKFLGMSDVSADEATRKLEDALPTIRRVNEQFKNPVRPDHLAFGSVSKKLHTILLKSVQNNIDWRFFTNISPIFVRSDIIYTSIVPECN